MKPYLITVFVLALLVTGCRQQQQARAKIFERKELKENRLMIRYEYAVNDKFYTDSATVANVVIDTDSIIVIIDPAHPERSIPDIKQ